MQAFHSPSLSSRKSNSALHMNAKKKVTVMIVVYFNSINFSFKIVITGVGAITPVGIGSDASYKAMCEGKSGIVRLPSWADEYPAQA